LPEAVNKVVGRVVGTMQGIDDGSRKDGDIVSVIDGIGFQTSILAQRSAEQVEQGTLLVDQAAEQSPGAGGGCQPLTVSEGVRVIAQSPAGPSIELQPGEPA
jgi:hypothetical protein